MAKARDARQFLELAVEIERKGYNFYEAAAPGKSKEVQFIFRQLADREREHEHTFRDMLTQLGGYMSDKPCEDFDYVKSLADSTIFTQMQAQALLAMKNMTELEALETGVGFEKDSILLYSEVRAMVPSEGQITMDLITDEEKKHLSQLTAMATKIRGT